MAFATVDYQDEVFLRMYGKLISLVKPGVVMGVGISAAMGVVMGVAMGLLTLFSATLVHADDLQYDALFTLEVDPNRPVARGSLTIKQSSKLLKGMNLNMPEERYTLLSADGDSERKGDRVHWQLDKGRSRLTYEVKLTQPRGKAYDALLTEKWALLRGDDVFPAAQTDEVKGARSRTELSIQVPKKWKQVTGFELNDDGTWRVDNPDRLFDRPTGWILLGRLGVKRETIAGLPVTVAAPIGVRAQRVSMLALLRWNLGWYLEQLPKKPERMLIVAGPDPLWRGGLSAPNSLFLHSDLALISEDGSSPLLHEVAHVLFPVDAAHSADWIDEGLAEYLSLRVMRETGTLSASRYRSSIKHFRKRGQSVKSLRSANSYGAVTARAVAMLHDLDEELLAASDGKSDIMDFIREMMAAKKPLTMENLAAMAKSTMGVPSRSLADG
jgi:hypothetical protein